MWTLDSGNKVGSHMFFYVTLNASIMFIFKNKKGYIHSFENNPKFKKNILTIEDNIRKKYLYQLENQSLIPMK